MQSNGQSDDSIHSDRQVCRHSEMYKYKCNLVPIERYCQKQEIKGITSDGDPNHEKPNVQMAKHSTPPM